MKPFCCLECGEIIRDLTQYNHEIDGLVIDGFCKDCHLYSRWKLEPTEDAEHNEYQDGLNEQA